MQASRSDARETREHNSGDPTDLEEKIMGSRMTFGLKDDSTICAIQKGNVGYLTDGEIDSIVERSFSKAKELRKLLPPLK